MSNIRMQNYNLKKASTLVLVLIVLSSITVLSVGLVYRTRIELKLAQSNARRTKVYYLALGGIERIKALIYEQEPSPETIARISWFDNSAKTEKLFEQLKDSNPTGEPILTYGLRDEQACLNINYSDPLSWENTGVIDRDCIAGILDWIDADEDISPGGAETDFYTRLETPYNSKNNPFAVLKELVLVKGITRDTYLGKVISQNSLLEANKNLSQIQILPDELSESSDAGLLNIFTVYGDGKININTASKTILAALPGLDEEAANIILNYRLGIDGRPDTSDDSFLTGAEEFAILEGLSELQIELLQQYCCFSSEHFRVFSYAVLDSTFQCCSMATIKSSGDKPEVMYVERLF
jgi:type II secretory pathway component PulK